MRANQNSDAFFRHLLQIIQDNFPIFAIKVAGGFCTIRFVDRGGGIKVRESRLYPSREAAEASLPKKEMPKKSHWEF